MTHPDVNYSSLPPPPSTSGRGAMGRDGSLGFAVAAVVLVSISWIGLLVDRHGAGSLLGRLGAPLALIFVIVGMARNKGRHRRLVLSLGALTIALVFAGAYAAFGMGLHDLGEDLVPNAP